jgi:hypothetical protein
VAVLLGIFASAGTAGAADIELAFEGGAATTPEPSRVNPVGASVGGRVGVSFLGGFYVGASVMSSWFDVSSPGPAPPSSLSVLTLGGDLGYGVAVRDWLTLRPQLGLGMAIIGGPVVMVGGEPRGTWGLALYVEPGLAALFTPGPGPVFLGADASVLVLDLTPGYQPSVTLHGELGVKF